MLDYQIWERGQEQVSLHMSVSGAGFVIDVETTPNVWIDIQEELKNDSYARTENTHTSNQVTVPTIRKRHPNVTRPVAQRAAEHALVRLGFTKM